jgi:hypothetical protein
VITLHQPWASLIALGHKHNETRSYPLKHRGILAIHAAASKPDRSLSSRYDDFRDLYDRSLPDLECLPLGKVLCLTTMTDCQQMTEEMIRAQSNAEIAVGNWFASGADRKANYAWKLENVQRLPFPFCHKGQQGIHSLSAAEITEVYRQINAGLVTA